MELEWDEAKSERNLRERGFDFAYAALIFDGPVIEREDDRRDYGEARFIAIGVVDGEHLVLVYTPLPAVFELSPHVVLVERSAMPTIRRSLAAARAEARVDPARLRATDDTEIIRQVASDPDTAPIQADLPRALARGEAQLTRPIDPRAVRRRLGMSQIAFASMFGVSVWTLRNWEQGRRRPEGPARALLRVIDQEPEAARRALGG